MSAETVIQVRGLSKRYNLGSIGFSTFVEGAKRMMGVAGQSGTDRLWALRNINLDVRKGEIVGIIGRNGAGKSTLLKILTRVTTASEGFARLKGRVSSMLEVGTGFHPDLTGRENVYLNGAILGMSRKEIEAKFDAIIEFSGIEKFVDTPVKRYSSGMYVRLAFAVAAHLEPEILLVDEVLAVGDYDFQRRCMGKMTEVAGGGRTILFVSHNLAAIQRLCHRVLVLRDGEVFFDGDPAEAVAAYLGYESSPEASLIGEDLAPYVSLGMGEDPDYFKLEGLTLEGRDGLPRTAFDSDEPVIVRVRYRLDRLAPKSNVIVLLSDEAGEFILRTERLDDPQAEVAQDAGLYESICEIPPNLFGERTFYLTVNVQHYGQQAVVARMVMSFDVRFSGYTHVNYTDMSRRGAFLRPKAVWQTRKLEDG